MDQTNQNNKPQKKFSAGGISAAIWSNHIVVEGEERELQTVSLERSYKDKDGSWRTSHSLRISDLPKAQIVLQKAFEHLVLRTQEQGLPVAVEDV